MIENINIEYEIETDWQSVNEPVSGYSLQDDINKLTYEIIGACIEVYNELGKGFSEVVYKDAIQIELNSRNINFEREKKYEITYKRNVLSHYYFADFVVEGKVIVELKAQTSVVENHYRQTINYLAVSNCPVALIINFGEDSLKYKRVVLTKNKN